MAIAAADITVADQGGQAQSHPQFADRISFAGEASYPTGGMLLGAGFAEKLKSGRTVLGIIAGDCGGYIPVWIPATSAVKVYESDIDSDQPLKEVDNADNLSGVTFNLVVLSK
jgi:hypothetical protein